MNLSSAQKSIAASWLGLAIALYLLFFVNEYVGCTIGFVTIVLFRTPHVNEAKSFVRFTKERPKSAYTLAGMAAVSSIALCFGSLLGYGKDPNTIGSLLVDKYLWVPIGFWILLLAAHELWLFPKLREAGSEM